jgi:predicted TPR repeat methyltransferase
MTKSKSLINGIGEYKEINKYYNDWSNNYDNSLLKWNYKTPLNSALILKSLLLIPPNNLLDLACGTGLFAEEILKFFPKLKIDGIDISKKILTKAQEKKIYRNLYCCNFDKSIPVKKNYDLVSCIGAMTYTKDPEKLLINIHKVIKKNGFFIFSHRTDLWKSQNYTKLLFNLKKKWQTIKISRPLIYLPNNEDFNNKIKIRIVLLRRN